MAYISYDLLKSKGIKGFELGGKLLTYGQISVLDVDLPKSAVIHPTGLYINAPMGNHMHIASILHHLFLIDNEKDLMDIVNDDMEILYTTKAYRFYNKQNVNDYVYIKNEYSDYVFLNKNAVGTIGTSDIVKKIANNWLDEYGEYVWGIRVFIYMLDDDKHDFWAENSYTRFKDLYREKFGITIPTRKFFLETMQFKNAFQHRYDFVDTIEDCFKGKKEIAKKVLSEYPTIRELLGKTPYYGSLWDENYMTNDLDHIVLDRPDNKKLKFKFDTNMLRLENAMESGDTVIVLNDTQSKVMKAVSNTINIKTYKTNISLEFELAEDVVLRNIPYSRGEVLRNVTFDEDVIIEQSV